MRGYAGDGGPAVQALLNEPTSIAVGPDNNLYIADAGNHRLRRIEGDGRLYTLVVAVAPVSDVTVSLEGQIYCSVLDSEQRVSYQLMPDGQSLSLPYTNDMGHMTAAPDGGV